MDRIERSIRSIMALLATAALLTVPATLAAQSATEAQEQQQENQERARTQAEAGETPAQSSPESRPSPAPRAVPHVTGTIVTWNGYRIDLKTPDGKTQQVAINEGTEQLVEIKPGAEVTVEYRRKIGDFVIAERVRPVEETGTDTSSAASPATVTGTLVTWSNAALVLRTETGDVTLFLSPRTESLDQPLEAGLPLTVEYQETADGAKLATRIQAVEAEVSSEQPTSQDE